MKLYTRTGDTGTTALFGGTRVSKDHARLEAYGTLDELNSVIGLLVLEAHSDSVPPHIWHQIQADIFVLGAHLATPAKDQTRLDPAVERSLWAESAIEADIDRLTALAPPLTSFVLPGGSRGAAVAHVARTVCRRAERLVVAVARDETIPDSVLVYLNRLSDWLFALARAENALRGTPDVPWRPNENS